MCRVSKIQIFTLSFDKHHRQILPLIAVRLLVPPLPAVRQLCELLYAFIYRQKYFKLTEFNRRLKNHKFGPINKNTNIALVTEERIEQRKLNTSASEMLVLFTNFGLMVGDLVPEDAPEWSVYLLMRQIIAIVLQKKIHKSTHYLLKDLVAEHHILFQKVFKTTLTPKLHFMVHYSKIMKKIGPICGIEFSKM